MLFLSVSIPTQDAMFNTGFCVFCTAMHSHLVCHLGYSIWCLHFFPLFPIAAILPQKRRLWHLRILRMQPSKWRTLWILSKCRIFLGKWKIWSTVTKRNNSWVMWATWWVVPPLGLDSRQPKWYPSIQGIGPPKKWEPLWRAMRRPHGAAKATFVSLKIWMVCRKLVQLMKSDFVLWSLLRMVCAACFCTLPLHKKPSKFGVKFHWRVGLRCLCCLYLLHCPPKCQDFGQVSKLVWLKNIAERLVLRMMFSCQWS